MYVCNPKERPIPTDAGYYFLVLYTRKLTNTHALCGLLLSLCCVWEIHFSSRHVAEREWYIKFQCIGNNHFSNCIIFPLEQSMSGCILSPSLNLLLLIIQPLPRATTSPISYTTLPYEPLLECRSKYYYYSSRSMGDVSEDCMWSGRENICVLHRDQMRR